MSDEKLILQVNDLSIVFGGLKAVSELNMELRKREL